jgi:anti-anti-sigma factor
MNEKTGTKPDDTTSIPLQGTQDVRNAAELHQKLLSALGNGQTVVVDCSEVESVDAACLQLLLAAKRENSQLVIKADATSETAGWIRISGLADRLYAKCDTLVDSTLA